MYNNTYILKIEINVKKPEKYLILLHFLSTKKNLPPEQEPKLVNFVYYL